MYSASPLTDKLISCSGNQAGEPTSKTVESRCYPVQVQGPIAFTSSATLQSFQIQCCSSEPAGLAAFLALLMLS